MSLPYYRLILDDGLPKFVQFAKNVWGVNPEGRSDKAVALEGLDRMQAWMRELGVAMSIAEFGATEADLDKMVSGVMILDSGYRKLTPEEVKTVLKNSLEAR